MKRKKTPTQSAARKKKAAPSRKSKSRAKAPDTGQPEESAATKRFLEDLAIRGEAVEVPAGKKAPSQATHVITKKNPDGTIQVKRIRYKLV